MVLPALDDRLLGPLADGQMLIERLHPVLRARVLLALIALIILGVGLMLLARMGARFVRNYGRIPTSRTKTSERVEQDGDEWWRKPLIADAEEPASGDEGG